MPFGHGLIGFWPRLDSAITWLGLARLRNSFLSKAITTFSLAALVLGNLSSPLEVLGVDPWTTKTLLAGSAIFLMGYLAFGCLAPPEFRRAGELDELVSRMIILSDWYFFDSRRDLATKLLERSCSRHLFAPPKGAVAFLLSRLGNAEHLDENADWLAASPGLYHADIDLRQHDKPGARIFVAALLAVGCSLVSVPTLVNVTKAMGV